MVALRDSWFKFILFLVGLIFLFLTLGAGFCHNHNDADFHKNCPACIWQSISIIFSISFFLFSLIFLRFKPSFYSVQIFTSKTYQVFHLRSPPLSALIP